MTDYASLADLRGYLRVTDAEDTADDAYLTLALGAATSAIDRACNRTFGLVSAAEARYFTAAYDDELCCDVVSVDDFMTATGLLVAGDPTGDGSFSQSIAAGDLRSLPLNAAQRGRPWTRLASAASLSRRSGRVRVTAKWGWTTVPSTIKNATLIQASRYLKRRDAPFGVAGSPDMGNELRLLAKLDPDVELMVGDFRRWWSAV